MEDRVYFKTCPSIIRGNFSLGYTKNPREKPQGEGYSPQKKGLR